MLQGKKKVKIKWYENRLDHENSIEPLFSIYLGVTLRIVKNNINFDFMIYLVKIELFERFSICMKFILPFYIRPYSFYWYNLNLKITHQFHTNFMVSPALENRFSTLHEKEKTNV